jgi:hypothetical protein
MRPPLISRKERIGTRPYPLRSDREGERGVTLALVAVGIFSIVGMAALSIDIGTLYQASTEAQRAADAAALTAARVISMSGITGDPSNTSGSWQMVCGTTPGTATEAATAVAQQSQNIVAGAPAITVNVAYGAGGSATDCSTLAGASSTFAVNPIVTVKVTQSNLRTYFSRLWFKSVSSVSATATAEVYNPANSTMAGTTLVPVQPRCTKPWAIPNLNPLDPGKDKNGRYCAQQFSLNPTCNPFVGTTAGNQGSIQDPGVSLISPPGVIGEEFTLWADCNAGGQSCALRGGAEPQANMGPGAPAPTLPNLQYVPGEVNPAIAISTSGASCASVNDEYGEAIAGCDQTTQFQCGTSGATTPYKTDLYDYNPSNGSTSNGAQCLIHANGTGSAPDGQDTLALGTTTYAYPFQIQAGSNSPLSGLVPAKDTQITSSDSIVSLPIYDSNGAYPQPQSSTESAVNIVGFLQVFINYVNTDGSVDVVVMNVVGCGEGTDSTTFINGSSPVPVRLITPPPAS